MKVTHTIELTKDDIILFRDRFGGSAFNLVTMLCLAASKSLTAKAREAGLIDAKGNIIEGE